MRTGTGESGDQGDQGGGPDETKAAPARFVSFEHAVLAPHARELV